jgi:di/tricarboxylate transporter
MIVREVVLLMSQEKIAKLLMLVVLIYVGLPVLSFEELTMKTFFSIAWTGFAGMLFLSLLFNKNEARKRTVKKQAFSNQKSRKRVHMES